MGEVSGARWRLRGIFHRDHASNLTLCFASLLVTKERKKGTHDHRNGRVEVEPFRPPESALTSWRSSCTFILRERQEDMCGQ